MTFAGPSLCQPAPRWTLRSRALLVIALALLVPVTTNWLSWTYQNADFPVKPRDFIIGFGGLMLMLEVFNRPAFCWQALLPAGFVLFRVIDAAVLQRYSVVALGTHEFYVMIMLSNFIVTLLLILLPSTERGAGIACWLASVVILACTAANLYEWAGYGSFTRIPGRMSGYLEDPNHSPILMCLLLGILFTINPGFWWNITMTGIAAVGIAITLSRSGMAVFAGMALVYIGKNFRQHAKGILIIAALTVPLAVAGFTFLAQSARSGVTTNEDVGARLEAIYNLDFEKIKSPERAKDLEDGLEAVGRAIMFGHGTGAGNNQWQPHNQFVSVWLDLGIFGLIFFAGLVLTLLVLSVRQRFRGIYCVMPVLLFIPCSQVLLDTPVYWLTITVALYTLIPRRIKFTLFNQRAISTHAVPSMNLQLSR